MNTNTTDLRHLHLAPLAIVRKELEYGQCSESTLMGAFRNRGVFSAPYNRCFQKRNGLFRQALRKGKNAGLLEEPEKSMWALTLKGQRWLRELRNCQFYPFEETPCCPRSWAYGVEKGL